MIKNCIQTNNLISSKNTILIFNILRNLGLTPTLKGTKLLNKAIQIVINSDNEFIVIEVKNVAFGDNGKRKKTFFEKLTMLVIVIMLIVTVGAIFAAALGALSY